MEKLRHGKYGWVASKLREGEEVSVGYKTKEQAEQQMKELAPAFRGKIVLFDTIENDLSNDDPAFDPSKSFLSKRWCIVVKNRMTEAEKPIGNSKALVSKLFRFAGSKDCNWKGQKSFVKFLIDYIRKNDMPGDDPKYKDIVDIDNYFHKIILDAAVAFRTSSEDYAVKIRKEYEEDTGHGVPDVNVFGMETSMFIQTNIKFITEHVFEERANYIVKAIDSLINAHYHYLDKIFCDFVRKVWRTGVCELIEKASDRGLKGKFGDVTLLTWTMCGRTAIQFDNVDGSSVSYMAGEDDYQAYSAGLNFCHADLFTAVKMIETVITNWPENKEEQAKIFSPDKKVKLDVVALMDAQKEAEQKATTE